MNATEASPTPLELDLDFITVWECEPPPDGVPFRVLDEEWTADARVLASSVADYRERHIRSWSGA